MQSLIQQRRTQLRKVLNFGIGACFMLVGPSCGSWNGNPPASTNPSQTAVEEHGTVDLSIQGAGTSLRLIRGTVAVINRNGQAAGQLTISSARMALGSIKLRSDKSDEKVRPLLAGPFIVDLLNNSVTPDLDRLTLPKGEYKDISMRCRPLKTGEVEAGDALLGHSLVLTGIYTAKNSKTSNVTLALNVEDEISLMKDSQTKAVQVQAGLNQQIIVAFRLDQWFNFTGKDVDFDSFVGNDITISSDPLEANKKLQEALLANIKKGADFGEDEDKDGLLGKKEDNDDSNDKDEEESDGE